MRNTKMAAVAVAILCLGIVSVAAFTPQPRTPEAAPRAVSSPEPALETFYVPAQHVNAATLGGPIEEPVQEFY
jgi:hypothetical protein